MSHHKIPFFFRYKIREKLRTKNMGPSGLARLKKEKRKNGAGFYILFFEDSNLVLRIQTKFDYSAVQRDRNTTSEVSLWNNDLSVGVI